MYVRVVLLALASIAVLSLSAEKVRFDNYRVISVKVENEQHRQLLEQLEASSDSVQFIKPAILQRNAEIIVAPHKLADIDEFFELNGIKSEVKTENLQKYELNFAVKCFAWILTEQIFINTDTSTVNNQEATPVHLDGKRIIRWKLFTNGWMNKFNNTRIY